MNATWRLLLTGPGEPGFNMALDEALAIAVRRGWSPPTLRIYRWQTPAISLGCHQPASVLEIVRPSTRPFALSLVEGRVAGSGRTALLVVRRPTAGGAVHHAQDISYALACGTSRLGGRPGRALYAAFHAALGQALATGRYTLYQAPSPRCTAFGFCFRQPVADDLMDGPHKVAGAAQRRWRDGLLQQGTVAANGHSADRVALSIRTAWADVFQTRFAVETLTVQERLLADELWSKYRPWTPSSWPPAIPSGSNR